MAFRDGKKIRGTHTTLCDLAARVTDIAVKIDIVSGVSPGMLQSGKGKTGASEHRVRIGKFEGGLLLTVRQSRSVQELRVYSHNTQDARLALARALRNANIPIAFRKLT